MQEAPVEPGRRPAQPQQLAAVDLRRPKAYAAAANKVAEGGVVQAGNPCPRCASRDTKFCYYNNYNTSQPRHFCKGCRRYWTKGGTLRNVPVGGGTRKKPSSSSYAAAGAEADGKPPTKKKPASKKRRVEAPVPTAAANASTVVSDPVADSGKTTTTATDGASDITTETTAAVPPAAMPVAEEEDSDSLAHLLLQPATDDATAVALGLGLSDLPSTAGNEAAVLDLDDDSFVWPPAYDLGTCWASAGFVDPDPTGLFLNLP